MVDDVCRDARMHRKEFKFEKQQRFTRVTHTKINTRQPCEHDATVNRSFSQALLVCEHTHTPPPLPER